MTEYKILSVEYTNLEHGEQQFEIFINKLSYGWKLKGNINLSIESTNNGPGKYISNTYKYIFTATIKRKKKIKK